MYPFIEWLVTVTANPPVENMGILLQVSEFRVTASCMVGLIVVKTAIVKVLAMTEDIKTCLSQANTLDSRIVPCSSL